MSAEKSSTEALKREHTEYLNKHPEVRAMMSDFLSHVLETKPENVKLYAAQYFTKLATVAAASQANNSLLTASAAIGDAKSANSSGYAPLVICGPSGVGKGTLITKIKSLFNNVAFTVSHTSRGPREGEVNGVHYHFVTRDAILAAIENGEFLEHAHVHGNIYGTSYAAIKSIQDEGKLCILDIDVQGVKTVKGTDLNPKIIYVAPPSKEELEKRLRGRGTETEEDILKRLNNSIAEMEWLEKPGNVHYRIVNDDSARAFEELKGVIRAWYPGLT